MKMEKVLITGGAGFIGLHLAEIFQKRGFAVDLVDNFSRGADDEALHHLISFPNVRLFSLDLMQPKITEKLDDDYTYIFHLAAIIGVANVLRQPFEVLRKNAVLLLNMLDFAKRQKKLERFLFASTSEVYAGTLKYFDMPIPTPETTPLAVTDLTSARTSYMLSKIYGEALCNASGLPVTSFRPHNIYGPRMGMSHVIPELLKKAYFAQNSKGLEVYSTEHRRTFCYIDDAVEILFRAAQAQACLGQTINLGNQSPEVSMREVGEIVLKVTNKKMPIIPLPATEGSPERRCPDMTKTTSLVGYQAKTGLEEGIQKTFDWYKAHVFDKQGA